MTSQALNVLSRKELGHYVLEHTLPDGECLVWQGHINKDGYGELKTNIHLGMAHRLSYEASIGVIPDGMTVDHLCFNTACVNPDHLRLLSNRENAQNQRSAFKERCVNGHEYTPENTYIRPRRYRGGVRDCRTCIRERVRKYRNKGRITSESSAVRNA